MYAFNINQAQARRIHRYARHVIASMAVERLKEYVDAADIHIMRMSVRSNMTHNDHARMRGAFRTPIMNAVDIAISCARAAGNHRRRDDLMHVHAEASCL